jgi:hypothetical protein
MKIKAETAFLSKRFLKNIFAPLNHPANLTSTLLINVRTPLSGSLANRF